MAPIINTIKHLKPMETIELQNEDYFIYCQNENNLVLSGVLTGTYVLCKHIKCKNFQAVICIDSKEVYLINLWSRLAAS